MTKKPLINVPGSIRQRLQNVAKRTNRPFDEVLQYFAMERFLYRLSQTPHSTNFILKGALLFRIWETPDTRATRDIDFLAYMDNSPNSVAQVIREACEVVDEEDGLKFNDDSINATAIKEYADYEGVRVRFRATLENARVTLQVDVGFGDTVSPAASIADYPTLLDLKRPKIKIYPPETVIAEKVEAMVNLGTLNSRMKDFHDVWRMSRQFEFEAPVLKDALTKTFENRKTEIITFNELSSELLDEKDRFQGQWSSFLEKNQVAGPTEFFELLRSIEVLLAPILVSILNDESMNESWVAPGPWN